MATKKKKQLIKASSLKSKKKHKDTLKAQGLMPPDEAQRKTWGDLTDGERDAIMKRLAINAGLVLPD
jgi:hypothetical protein